MSSDWININLSESIVPNAPGPGPGPEAGTGTETAPPSELNLKEIAMRIGSLIMTAKDNPYINSLVTTFELGKVITGYVQTTHNIITKTPDINSNFLYKSIANGLIFSDTAKCLSFLSSKGIKNQSLEVFNAVFGEQILQNGANFLQNIPFIGGVFTENNLEGIFVTSVNSIITSQISGTINGYFQQIENETKIKNVNFQEDDDDSKKNKNKKDVVTKIEENIKLRIKYKNEGFTNEEIAEILEQGEIDPEKEYQTIIGKGINTMYRKFNQYKRHPGLVLQSLCNTIFTFKTIHFILYSSLSGIIFTITQDFIYTGTIHSEINVGLIQFTIADCTFFIEFI